MISSGSLFGQYFQLEKVSKIFVPVETTDFIFAAYAYNFGFVGVLFILFLWFVFFLRLTQLLVMHFLYPHQLVVIELL